MKIAITTNDGVNVNEHFGKADKFHIYDLADSKLEFIEVRDVDSYCDSSSGEPVDSNHKYSVDKLSIVYAKISDCVVLYTKQIGEKPQNGLTEMGIQVKLCSCAIESIVGCSDKCK